MVVRATRHNFERIMDASLGGLELWQTPAPGTGTLSPLYRRRSVRIATDPTVVVGGVLFGLNVERGFSVAMVGCAGAATLNDAANIFCHCSEDRHVGAAFRRFASVALIVRCISRIFMSRN